MANLKATDADGTLQEIKAGGSGTTLDPLVLHRTADISSPLNRRADAESVSTALSTEDVAILNAIKTAVEAGATQTTLAALLAKIIAAPATEAKQDTIISALSAIAGYTDGIEGLLARLPSSGAASDAVLTSILNKIIAAPATEAKQDAQATTLAAILAKIIAAPATEAKQDTQITTLAAILAKLIAAPATEAKQDTIIARLPSGGVASDATAALLLQEGAPVTGESLETGGSHALGWLASIRLRIGNKDDAAAASDTGTYSLIALVKRLLGKLPTLGPKAKAGAVATAFATDQVGTAGSPATDVLSVQGVANGTAIPISQNDPTAVTGTISTQDSGSSSSSGQGGQSRITGTPTAGSTVASSISGASSFAIQVDFGSANGTIQFERTIDGGVSWVPTMLPLYGVPNSSVSSVTGNAVVHGTAGPNTAIRARAVGAVGGTGGISIRIQPSYGNSIISAAQAGIWTPTPLTLAVSGTGSALNDLVIPATDVSMYKEVAIQLTNSWTATLAPEISTNGGLSWNSAVGRNAQNGQQVINLTGNGNYVFGLQANAQFRLRVAAYTSGTITGHAAFCSVPSLPSTLTILAGATLPVNVSQLPPSLGPQTSANSLATVPAATETHIGEVGGNSVVLPLTFAIRESEKTNHPGLGAGTMSTSHLPSVSARLSCDSTTCIASLLSFTPL